MILKYYQKLDDAISYLFSSVSNEKKLLKSILKKKEIFYVDIGTNEGSYLEFLMKHFKFKKAVCFEPIKELVEKVSKKFQKYNIEVHNFALSNKRIKNRKFYHYNISSQSSLYEQNNLFQSLKNLKNIKKIDCKKFDDCFKNKEQIDYCKIDVQGEEVNVLKGMEKNLKKRKINLIKIEISFTERYKNVNSNFYDIVFFLKKYNYNLISISKIKYKNERILLMDAFFLSSNFK